MVEAWTYNQLIKARQYHPELVDTIFEELLTKQNELRWLLVIGAYTDKEINLGKAAELLGMHRIELEEEFRSQGIPVRMGSDSLEEARAEAAAVAQWNAAADAADCQ
jgi:predicted HTH domain antitoxin